jgi:lysophospholipase L1-like esterase
VTARRAGLAVLLGGCLLLLALPDVGRAACGGVMTSRAARHPHGQAPPLAIGDSTLLLSRPGLAARGFDVNAHGCRQFSEALAMLGRMRAQRTLPHLVAMFLGANGPIAAGDIHAALRLLGPNRLLVLVTPRQLGGGSGANAALERREARDRPGRIILLDWVAYSAGHAGWFQPDRLHLTLAGVDALNRLLARVLPYAYEPCPPSTDRAARRAHHRRHLGQAHIATDTLTLAATPYQVGYIGVTVSGPPGAVVQLSQTVGGAAEPLRTVTLAASGTTTIGDLAPWLCFPRTRTLTATIAGPVSPPSATLTVTNPSCVRRLAVTLDRRARAGGSLAIHVRDRWKLGAIPFALCLAPPGARAACSQWRLAPGADQRVIHVGLPRPGGWRVSLRAAFVAPTQRLVWAPARGDRIRLLAAGDSEMQILDGFIAGDLAGRGVQVTSDARISTGLTNSFFFDWQRHARTQAAGLRPDVTVVFMGANDGWSVNGPDGRPIQCCTPAWSAGYARLAAEMMRTYLRGNGGRVYWFLLPAPRPAKFKSLFDAVNAGLRAAARQFPGRVALIDANAFFTPGNRYRDYMVYHRHGFVIHESDGIHLSTASDQIDAALLVRRLQADHVIR